MEIPKWLAALIHANFFKRKGNNIDTDYKYCCVRCASKSLTAVERIAEHKDHWVLEPLKCSGYCGYRVDDIKKLQDHYFGKGLDLDMVSGVAEYTINSNKIFYPKSRREFRLYKESHGVTNCCFTCGFRIMVKSEILYDFCSILCSLIYQLKAQDDKDKLDALTAPLKNHHRDSVVEKNSVVEKKEENYEKEKSRAVLEKSKVDDANNNETNLIKKVKEKRGHEEEKRSGVLSKKLKLGANDGGIKKLETKSSKGKEVAVCEEVVWSPIIDEICSKGKEVEVAVCEEVVWSPIIDEICSKGKEVAICEEVVWSPIIDEILMNDGGKKISGLKRMEMEFQEKLKKAAKRMLNKKNNNKNNDDDEKLQSLISVSMEMNDAIIMSNCRKRSRKGTPCRSPV